MLTVFFVLSFVRAFAGECVTDDKTLYTEVVETYDAAKQGSIQGGHSGWDMQCWRGGEGYDVKLKKILLEMLADSSIHPAYVAMAAKDYQSVFPDKDSVLGAMLAKQGAYRSSLIRGLLEPGTPGAFPAIATQLTITFPVDLDFIDGPANLRDQPKGKVTASLPDNTKVRVLKQQDEWVQVEQGSIRGWTHRKNLMSRTLGQTNAVGFTTLSRAAFMGYLETVQFLLSRGADVNAPDGRGKTALHRAVEGGFTHMGGIEIEIVKKLAALRQADINRKDQQGNTPLLLAVRTNRRDVVAIILARTDTDVNAGDSEGVTPLVFSVRYGQQEMTQTLLSVRSINIDQPDANGGTPLFYAIVNRHRALIHTLLERKARTDIVTKDGKTLLHALFEPLPYRLTPDPPPGEIVTLLLACKDIGINKEDSAGNSALTLSIERDMLEVVKLLVARKELDVNKRRRDGNSHLNRVLPLSNLHNAYPIALLLLERPEIDVNVPNASGRTAVHLDWYNAGMGEHGIALAKKILLRKPNPNVMGKDGDTPLSHNIWQNYPEIVRLLVTVPGINLELPDRQTQKTPLGLAKFQKKQEIIEILTKAGAREFPIIGNSEKTPEGIPQSLLKDENTYKGVVFYRNYLRETFERALDLLRDGYRDGAIRELELSLDVVLIEVNDHLHQFSKDQRGTAKKMFQQINEYRQRYPRVKTAWYGTLTAQQKQEYAGYDSKLTEVLSGKFDDLPISKDADHAPRVPIMILREYQVRNSIDALDMIQQGNNSAAETLLQALVGRSTLRSPASGKNKSFRLGRHFSSGASIART